MSKIVVIDDEPAMVEVISTLCRENGHQVNPFNSAERALEELAGIAPQVVIADIKMEKVTGFDVLQHVRRTLPQTAVILITAYASVEKAVEAMKLGAYDFVTKPFKIDELKFTIQRALEHQSVIRENAYLKKEVKNRYRFENIIGTSRAMQDIYSVVNKVADTDSTILIQGESGTGKELVARALHFNSKRQSNPFVAVNCSALPENLLESELFGHKKGAFTGAFQDKIGLFEEAEGGTIFLDEVNSMAMSLQTKLLRVLQERMIRRVGDTKTTPIIPLLVQHFLQKNASQIGTDAKKIEPDSLEALARYSFPGNVRELENAIERACALCENGLITVGDLPPGVQGRGPGSAAARDNIIEMPIGQRLDEFIQNEERGYIEKTLRYNNGSREKTASMLGISMATLYRKLELGKQKRA